MQKLGSGLRAIFSEAVFLLIGVIVTLAAAALFLHLCAPIRSEYYPYLCFGSAIIGFMAWLFLVPLFFRDRKPGNFVPAAFGVLLCSLNFQLMVPLGIERSITVFILSEMAHEPVQAYSAPELEQKFLQNYLKGRHAIDKRLKENGLSGTIEQTEDRYRLSKKGEYLVSALAVIGRIFSVPRLQSAETPLPVSTNKR